MKIYKFIVLILLSLTFCLGSFGQSKFIYTGVVRDSLNNTPIPFCNVYLENSSIGTITNNDGNFKLIIPTKTNKNLCISFIGYKTKKIPVAKLSGTNNSIKLSKDEIALDEVVIMPDSTLLGFLRKAYRTIDKNYPQVPTKLDGFYRETMLTDKDEYLYLSEAILNIFKNSYKLSNDPGQVKIIESRKKAFPLLEEVNNVKIYAGAFIPLNLDFVQKRKEFINPKHFDKYTYKLSNTTKLDGRIVYEISFDTNNDTLKGLYKGKYYIDKESLAYISADYERTPKGIQKHNATKFTPYKAIEAKYLVQYHFFNNKWHLKYCKGYGKSFNTTYNTNLKYGNEFLTTNITTDSVEAISYEKQLRYYDIFLDEATPYDSTNWKDFNVIKTNDNLLVSIDQAKNIFQQKVVVCKENKIISFAKRLDFNYGISLFQNKIPSGEFQVIFDNNTLSQNILNKNYLLALEANISYLFNKNLSFKYFVIGSLDKTFDLESYGLGLGYTKNIKPKGKPLFFKADLYGYKDSYGIIFNQSLNNIEYSNKQIANSKLVTQIVRESWGIKPNISLSYQMTRLLGVYLSCSYSFNLAENYILKFKEESGLFKKTYKKDIIDGTVNYNGNSMDLNIIDMNPFIIGIGFNLGFN